MSKFDFEASLAEAEARRIELLPDTQPARGLRHRRSTRSASYRKRATIIKRGGYDPRRGYFGCRKEGLEWIPVETHIKYPKNSNRQKWIKRETSRKMRRTDNPPKGNYYRRLFDYWWTMY